MDQGEVKLSGSLRIRGQLTHRTIKVRHRTLGQAVAQACTPAGTPAASTWPASVTSMTAPRGSVWSPRSTGSLRSVGSPTKKTKAGTSARVRKFNVQTKVDPDHLHSDCSPADLAAWFTKSRTWFAVAAPTPTPLHKHQLMNFISLKLDKIWESELNTRSTGKQI